MQASKALEMINDNRIDELKAALQDELFTETLSKKPNARKRYTAMKRYLKTISSSRPILTNPCEVEFEGEKYNSITNSFSLVLTKESCGEIEMCSEPEHYPNVAKLVSLEGEIGKIDFNKVLAEAKSKGYRFSKNAINKNDFLMKYKDGYYRMGLVDVTYGVLDEGKEVDVYFSDKFKPLNIQNDLGIGVILPIRYSGNTFGDCVVIEV